MTFKVPNEFRVRTGPLGSTDQDGNNGVFLIPRDKKRSKSYRYNVIASDELGWEHISVTLHNRNRCATWKEMCWIKDIFWDEDDTVIQYHPAKEDYVNYHPYCLHLWRPIDVELPKPPKIFVGPYD